MAHKILITENNKQSSLPEVRRLIEGGLKGGDVLLTFSRPTRNLDQNALMWCLLKDMSEQAEHFGRRYSKEDWKDILTSSFEGVTRFAPTIDGQGLVAFGARTSEYPKGKMAEFIEFIYSVGSERGVVFNDQNHTG